MTSNQIIESLKEVIASLKSQLEVYRLEREQYRLEREQDKRQINALLSVIAGLRKELASLHEAIDARNDDLRKAESTNKGLSKIIANKTERQQLPKPSEEDRQELERKRAEAAKARGNNGARRSTHPENSAHTKIVYVTPDAPGFDLSSARLVGGTDEDGNPTVYCESKRYRYHKGYMETILYRAPLYKQDGQMYRGKAPATPFLNSSYESSAIAHIMHLRYGYAMTVESICRMLREQGFNMSKKTADGLLRKTSGILENLYQALRESVLKADYLNIDETYYKILSERKPKASGASQDEDARQATDDEQKKDSPSSTDVSPARGSRKGYLWLVASKALKLSYFIYDGGSRSQRIILDELANYHGYVQSDGYSAYKKMETDEYKDIRRIACLQHIKRKFLDCGESNKEAREIVRLINKLYREEHKQRNDKDWTADDNLKWRQEYAPPILREIRGKLDVLLALPDKEFPPKSDLYTAVHYFDSEWNAMEGIFTRGDTALDNNLCESQNLYVAKSRRNSLFFITDEGGRRGAMFYSLTLSCMLNGVDAFEYFTDVIDKVAQMNPKSPIEKYRDLLPDRWTKQD